MINLSNLSDAELGALVRRSVGDLVMQQALEGAAARQDAEEQIHQAKIALAKAENRRRRSLITLPEFKLKRVTFAPLNVTEAQWDEVMPRGLATKYMHLIEWTFGFQFDPEDEDAYEVVTWRVAYGIHSNWCRPDGLSRKRFDALKTALKVSDAEALAAMWPIHESGKKAYEFFLNNVARSL